MAVTKCVASKQVPPTFWATQFVQFIILFAHFVNFLFAIPLPHFVHPSCIPNGKKKKTLPLITFSLSSAVFPTTVPKFNVSDTTYVISAFHVVVESTT